MLLLSQLGDHSWFHLSYVSTYVVVSPTRRGLGKLQTNEGRFFSGPATTALPPPHPSLTLVVIGTFFSQK